MDSRRMMQTVLGVLILVLVATFWNRSEAPVERDAPVPAVAVETPAAARASKPAAASASGAFDYYVLVLSWSPTHCAGDQGRGRDDDLQCRSGRPYGFVLHGLWPQHERGYPQDCPSDEPRAVDDELMVRMLEISPSAQLVQHEWRKHGTCAGISQADYFATAADAFRSVAVPTAYRAPTSVMTTTANDVRGAFLAVNPLLSREGVAATCRRNEFAEVWVCLDKTLASRACSKEVADRHCGARKLRMRAVRGHWPG